MKKEPERRQWLITLNKKSKDRETSSDDLVLYRLCWNIIFIQKWLYIRNRKIAAARYDLL